MARVCAASVDVAASRPTKYHQRTRCKEADAAVAACTGKYLVRASASKHIHHCVYHHPARSTRHDNHAEREDQVRYDVRGSFQSTHPLDAAQVGKITIFFIEAASMHDVFFYHNRHIEKEIQCVASSLKLSNDRMTKC